MNSLIQSFLRGFYFLRENPQVFYTILLTIVIPLAFLFSSQEFLTVAQTTQERLEKERIGIMQDTFVIFAEQKLSDADFLQKKIESLRAQNETFLELKVVRLDKNAPRIIASLKKDEIDTFDEINQHLYAPASINPSTSFIFEVSEGGGRGWKAVRGILNENRELVGFFYSTVSMAELDSLISKKIRNAYFFLVAILIVIITLLIRQAKMIDYARLYGKLREADSVKDEFLSIAAHELRSPLQAIKGYADELSTLKNMPKEAEKDISIIRISAERLAMLISDILDVSRLAQGRLSFDIQKIDPTQILERVIQNLKNEAEKKGLLLEFKKSSAFTIAADPMRLEQAFINLISNAIKYTPKGSILLSVEKQYDNGYIRVADTGLGISAEDQKHLFEKFFRIKSKETREIIGTGLGLWITKEIIEKMGGEILLESIKDVGAHFIIKFPIKE
ncbi:MAG: HAMP domain-containing sensor histidine kinase [Patescibacteria group bacterium]